MKKTSCILFLSFRTSLVTLCRSHEHAINWHLPWTTNNLILGHDTFVDFVDLRDGKGFRQFNDITNGTKIAVRIEGFFYIVILLSRLFSSPRCQRDFSLQMEKNNNVTAVLTRDQKLCLFDMRNFKDQQPLSTTYLAHPSSRVLFNSNGRFTFM